MPIIIDTFKQGSPEWDKARLGNVGGSSIDKLLTADGKISKQREDYMRQLVGEIICGKSEESFKSQDMINGNEREAGARKVFELIYGVEVTQVGIVYKDEKKLFHFSPDGLVRENAIFEVKNPKMKTHIKYLLEGVLPIDYFGQVQMGLYVCEREICYFMSNYDGLPPFIIEIARDEKYISKLAQVLDDFNYELALMLDKIKKVAA